MELPRFRRSTSWLESYGVDVGVAALLCATLAVLHNLSSWIRGQASLAQIASDFALDWRVNIAATLIPATLVLIGRTRLPERGAARWIGLIALVLAAGSLGYSVMQVLVLSECSCERWPPDGYWEIAWRHQVIVLTTTVVGIDEFMRRSRQAAESLHVAQMRRVELDGQLAAGQLQVLLAQIEPHFLFNSLANLRRLMRTDGEAGDAMLADLLRYLEIALPRMRAQHSTLARETELVRAFLAVHQVRMGARLQVDVDVPASLSTASVPPMMLLTLVENALKHGLNPLPEGGTIRVAASASEGRLVISVADTGRGLVPGSGGGTGLANIRSRLRAAYGATASLSLRLNQPHGVVATLVLPGLAA